MCGPEDEKLGYEEQHPHNCYHGQGPHASDKKDHAIEDEKHSDTYHVFRTSDHSSSDEDCYQDVKTSRAAAFCRRRALSRLKENEYDPFGGPSREEQEAEAEKMYRRRLRRPDDWWDPDAGTEDDSDDSDDSDDGYDSDAAAQARMHSLRSDRERAERDDEHKHRGSDDYDEYDSDMEADARLPADGFDNTNDNYENPDDDYDSDMEAGARLPAYDRWPNPDDRR
jgi:hypothetical protein